MARVSTGRAHLSPVVLSLLALLPTVAAVYKTEVRPRVHARCSHPPCEGKPRNATAAASSSSTHSLQATALPSEFSWAARDGVSYLTKVLNQHLPQYAASHQSNAAPRRMRDAHQQHAQNIPAHARAPPSAAVLWCRYCGSCWAFAAISSLNDRIKIARKGIGPDIHLSVQHVLNCGSAGTCNGGNAGDVYAWIQANGHVAFETVNPYIACSGGNPSGQGLTQNGFCSTESALNMTRCNAFGTARNCGDMESECTALNQYPNGTVASYGQIDPDPELGYARQQDIQREIMSNGPVACGVDANWMLHYPDECHSGADTSCEVDSKEMIILGPTQAASTNHVVSLVGWGTSPSGVDYWLGRNSWGESWGNSGLFKIVRGKNLANIESECVWATPGAFTETNANFPCWEDGNNCNPEGTRETHFYGGAGGPDEVAADARAARTAMGLSQVSSSFSRGGTANVLAPADHRL